MTADTGTDVQIHRADHGAEHPYFIQRRKTAQDNTLSFEARGVVGYLLSKPDDWTINEAELRKAGKIGRDKMKRILQELIDAGYMTSAIPRVKEGPTKAQFLPKVLALHECPNEPLTEKPSTANPSTANPHLHITDSTESEKVHSTGAEKAPDADSFPEGTIGFDEMLDRLDLTQADIDATPLDEIIPDPPKPKTPHNLMFEAICGVFGYDWNKITKSKRGQVNTATTQLIEAGAAIEDVPKLHAYCKKKFEQFGPVALATNWDDYKAERQAPANGANAEPVPFIHDPACRACNYGMVIDDAGKSIQCEKCAASKEKGIA